jgi:hypothetical protein
MEDLIQKTLSALNPIPITVLNGLAQVQLDRLGAKYPGEQWAQVISERLKIDLRTVYSGTPEFFFEQDREELKQLVREDRSLHDRVLDFAKGTLWEGFARRVLDECKRGGAIDKSLGDGVIFANTQDELKTALVAAVRTYSDYQTKLGEGVREKYRSWSGEGTVDDNPSKQYLVELLTQQAAQERQLFDTVDDFIHSTILEKRVQIENQLLTIHAEDPSLEGLITDLFQGESINPADILEFIEAPHAVAARVKKAAADASMAPKIQQQQEEDQYQRLKTLALKDTTAVGLQIQGILLRESPENDFFRAPETRTFQVGEDTFNDLTGTTERHEETKTVDEGGLFYHDGDDSLFLNQLSRIALKDREQLYQKMQQDRDFQRDLRANVTAPLLTLIQDKLTDLRGRGLAQDHPKIAYFTDLQTQLTNFRNKGTPVTYTEPSHEVEANIGKGFWGTLKKLLQILFQKSSASATLIRDKLAPVIKRLPEGSLMAGHPPAGREGSASSLGGESEHKGDEPSSRRNSGNPPSFTA